MFNRLLSFLLGRKEPTTPDIYWSEEWIPNGGCLEGDDARMLVKYKYGEPITMLPYHPSLVDSLIRNKEVVVDLTNQQSVGPGCIPKRNVVIDLVTNTLRKELRMWNFSKRQRRLGL